jgi:hypothetical protein
MGRAGWIAGVVAVASAPWAAAQIPSSGTISVEQAADATGAEAPPPLFVNALGEVLATKGFTTLEQPGHAALVADLRLTREQVGSAAADVPVERAVAGPGGVSGAVGGGISVTLPTAKKSLAPLVRTRMELRIRKRGEDAILWQGSAITVRPAGTATGRDEAVAADLSEAVLRSFPAQPGGVVTVP